MPPPRLLSKLPLSLTTLLAMVIAPLLLMPAPLEALLLLTVLPVTFRVEPLAL